MNTSPFDAIYHRNFEQFRPDKNVYGEAIDEMWRDFQPNKIRLLLWAENPDVVADGLYILSEMGTKAYEVIPDVIRHVTHEDWQARFYVADICLASMRSLQEDQIAKILPLCDDDHIGVREKMMRFLSRVEIILVKKAVVESVSLARRNTHQEAMSLLDVDLEKVSMLQKLIRSDDRLLRCYAGGAIIKLEKASSFEADLDPNREEEKYILFERQRSIT